MGDKKEPGGLLDTAAKVFDTLWNWPGATETWRWTLLGVVAITCVLVAIYFCAKALTALLEVILKCLEGYKSSGLPLWLSREDRIRVRRRSQFCGVLKADLAYIAKAESWNDQYFTDLEAEVESEGGYYASLLHKLLRKKSHGLRKERSLLRAISLSSERAIQLIGEPGAGKSVALRHLASQLAERGVRSKGKNALVPLYVNLREMVIDSNREINSDAIRDFIVDNVRRGDSDTSEFIKSNWDEYRDKGTWFFLFDSFDEIPAVLHAEKDAVAALKYSEAIRQFLDGMGSCKGILASREFKGPEALPWKKFRILSLSLKKQEELVSNSFLTPAQEKIVLLHLSSRSEQLAHTPLFLTLLCRYVKDEGRAPDNDYQLLSLQIERLARRDPSFLQRQYGLKPHELVDGAERIARAFAEEASIGLSPTIDQIEGLIPREEVPGGNIARIISAMVDCKIARADVPNAAPGDRRFAFAHRRYQEALFVRHLVRFPEYIAPDRLLTDPRWREYSVTLLETQPIEAAAPILNAAAKHLEDAALKQKRRSIELPASGDVGYFEDCDEAFAVLELLQEGLSRRIERVPESLKSQAAAFLVPRWDYGDSVDRARVIKVGALLPQELLVKYLTETFNSGSYAAQTIAFSQTTALRGKTPDVVRRAVLERLAAAVLAARDRASVLKLEALVGRLPPDVGAEYVLRRCQRIKAIIGGANWIVESALAPIKALAVVAGRKSRVEFRIKVLAGSPTGAIFSIGIMLLYVAALAAFLVIAYWEGRAQNQTVTLESLLQWVSHGAVTSKVIVALIFAVASLYLLVPLMYAFRSHGREVGVSYLLSRFARRDFVEALFRNVLSGSVALGAIIGLIYLLGRAVHLVASLLGYQLSDSPWSIGIVAFLAAFVVLIIAFAVLEERSRLQVRRDFESAKRHHGSSDYLALLDAKDFDQFVAWLVVSFRRGENDRLNQTFASRQILYIRCVSAILQGLSRPAPTELAGIRFDTTNVERSRIGHAINLVETDFFFYSEILPHLEKNA